MKHLIIILAALMELSVAETLNSYAAKYINKQIDKILQENPAKDVLEHKLNAEYNDQRMLLESAKFNDTKNITDSEESQAQANIKTFLNYATKFQEVSGRLMNAFEELENSKQNLQLPLSIKCEILALQLELHESKSIKEAEKILKSYQNFKKQSIDRGDPAVVEDQQKYLKEILKILKELSLHENPKMQNVLQDLLRNPNQLKTLAEALRKIRSEDDFEEDEDYWGDLFGAFFG